MAKPEEMETQQTHGRQNPNNVGSAIDFLKRFGSRVPSSIDGAGKGFYESLLLHGLEIQSIRHGRLICSLRVPRRLSNSKAWLHGGAIASLMDMLGSAAISSTGAKPSGASLDLNISFLSSAPAGEDIEIDARVLGATKNVAVVSVDVRRKSTGELIAQGRHTKNLGASEEEAASSKL